MKEYKRLTNEELEDYISRVLVQLEPTLSQETVSVIEEVLEYRTKIENGTLIELPCKVGDTVYRLLGYNNYDKWTVDKINTYVTKSGYDYCLVCSSKDCGWECFYEEDKGIEWSFEKPQAEQRLKELKGKYEIR